ncbi:hypothetical protein CR513_22140, partial [Mucuna pruriens]
MTTNLAKSINSLLKGTKNLSITLLVLNPRERQPTRRFNINLQEGECDYGKFHYTFLVHMSVLHAAISMSTTIHI